MRAQKVKSLFDTVPQHDYLGILREANPSKSSKKIVDFLKFNKTDVSTATGIPKASIRYDERLPQELMQRLQEIGVICEIVAEYFKGDLRKTALWFQIKNPMLGNISPRDMIRYGRYQKLIKFIRNSLIGNMP